MGTSLISVMLSPPILNDVVNFKICIIEHLHIYAIYASVCACVHSVVAETVEAIY